MIPLKSTVGTKQFTGLTYRIMGTRLLAEYRKTQHRNSSEKSHPSKGDSFRAQIKPPSLYLSQHLPASCSSGKIQQKWSSILSELKESNWNFQVLFVVKISFQMKIAQRYLIFIGDKQMRESLTLTPTLKGGSSSARTLNPGINMETLQKNERIKHSGKESLLIII